MNGPSWRVLQLVPSALLGFTVAALLFLLTSHLVAPPASQAASPADGKRLDPAAWGSDHVNGEIPEYVESGECLFCHRQASGEGWRMNRHEMTVRLTRDGDPALKALAADEKTKAIAGDVQLILGEDHMLRFLKRREEFGKADLLTTSATIDADKKIHLQNTDSPRWDDKTFAQSCAGCHMTAVDRKSNAFRAVALDCFACHGDSDNEHSNDTKLVLLAKARNDSPAVVTSICASCHLRGGKSLATGLPYPTNFVAGDNLFKDYQVNFDLADDPTLNPDDRHIYHNVREVVIEGREDRTCLSCHNVHVSHSKPHVDLPVEESCFMCHEKGDPIKGFKKYEVHSEACRY